MNFDFDFCLSYRVITNCASVMEYVFILRVVFMNSLMHAICCDAWVPNKILFFLSYKIPMIVPVVYVTLLWHVYKM